MALLDSPMLLQLVYRWLFGSLRGRAQLRRGVPLQLDYHYSVVWYRTHKSSRGRE